MKKHYITGFVALFFAVTLTSFASRKDEVTLLMIPREDGVVRVGMDIAKRYPTLLLSYKIEANGAVMLHGWSGKEWVSVSLKDFTEGNFFRNGPDSALIVETSGSSALDSLIPPEGWCSSVYKISTTEVRPLVHLVGQYYNFKHKDWTWFSENYQLPLDSINPEGLNVAWYHKRLNDNLKKRDPIVANDLQYWSVIRQPQPPLVIEEVEPTNSTEVIEVEEHPEMETPEDPTLNPLTNAAPEAVVLGAGDAEEITEIVEEE